MIDGVNAVSLKSTKNDDEKKISTHGVFVAIGHDPATKPFKNILELDDEGYIKVKSGTTLTSKVVYLLLGIVLIRYIDRL